MIELKIHQKLYSNHVIKAQGHNLIDALYDLESKLRILNESNQTRITFENLTITLIKE